MHRYRLIAVELRLHFAFAVFRQTRCEVMTDLYLYFAGLRCSARCFIATIKDRMRRRENTDKFQSLATRDNNDDMV